LSAKKRKGGATQNQDPRPILQTPRRQIVVAAAAILIVYVALRLPGLSVPLDRDEGAFGYMGQLINSGELPYRDGVDHKPPVAFYINALALHFVPPTPAGMHFFLLLYNLLTLICVFYVGKTYFQSLSAGLWCAFAYAVFSASPAIQGFTASTEMWMLLPLTLSLLLAILGAGKNRSFLMLLSGIAGAAACWTKQTAFTSVLFVFLFICVAAFRHGQHPTHLHIAAPFRALAFWIVGATLFSGFVMFYYYFHGVLGEFIYWSFLHNVSYAGHSTFGDSLDSVIPQLVEILRGDFLILGVGVVIAAWQFTQKQAIAYFVLGFLFLSFLGTIPGFGYRHYFAQLAPAVAIAGGYGLYTLMNYLPAPHRRSAAIACSVLVLLVPIIMNSQYFLEQDPDRISRRYFGFDPFPESKAVASYVAGTTTPADPIFIIGSEPQILFYARRRSSSSFLMAYPLTASYPRYKEFQKTVWDEIEKTPPKLIIKVANIHYSFLWDGIADLDIMRRLNHLIGEDYAVDRVMLVTGSEGEWVEPGDSRLREGVPCIYVYRKKG
jgi:hypothetical protein